MRMQQRENSEARRGGGNDSHRYNRVTVRTIAPCAYVVGRSSYRTRMRCQVRTYEEHTSNTSKILNENLKHKRSTHWVICMRVLTVFTLINTHYDVYLQAVRGSVKIK